MLCGAKAHTHTYKQHQAVEPLCGAKAHAGHSQARWRPAHTCSSSQTYHPGLTWSCSQIPSFQGCDPHLKVDNLILEPGRNVHQLPHEVCCSVMSSHSILIVLHSSMCWSFCSAMSFFRFSTNVSNMRSSLAASERTEEESAEGPNGTAPSSSDILSPKLKQLRPDNHKLYPTGSCKFTKG